MQLNNFVWASASVKEKFYKFLETQMDIIAAE